MGKVYWGAHGALANNAAPAALMLGDSWFWYPVDNLAVEIGGAYPGEDFVVIGRNGAEAAEWSTRMRKDVDFAFRMYASSVKVLLLSGGGNDIAGMADFLRILADDCSGAKTPQDCYRSGQPDEIVSNIVGAYRAAIIKFRAYNAEAPVFMHNYDYAWPTGKGFFGPGDWLKEPMDKAHVPKAVGFRHELLKDLLDRLGQAQSALAKAKGLGKLVAVKTAGTLPDSEDVWANELHPTPAGFRSLMKDAFLPQLRKFL